MTIAPTVCNLKNI